MKDLRSFMDRLEGEGPEELLHIRKPVRAEHDVTSLLMELEFSGRYPTLFVHEVQGYSMPVITNLHATRSRLAMALDVDANDLVEEYRRRESHPMAPELVKDGPVKEVMRTGADVDLGEIPLLTHFDISTAPYVTAGIVVARDPVSGVRNLSFNRAMMVERNRLRMHLAPGMHLRRCQRNAEERGEPLDIAFIVGVHPAFAIGALSLAAFDVDEYDVIGGMMEQPVPLVRCETVPIEVPAHAEMVLEGRILPNVREEEGPFGEFTGHAVGVRNNHVAEITGVTFRRKAALPGHFHRPLGAAAHGFHSPGGGDLQSGEGGGRRHPGRAHAAVGQLPVPLLHLPGQALRRRGPQRGDGGHGYRPVSEARHRCGR